MNCGQLCSRNVQLSPGHATARDAAGLMARDNVGALVVIDGKERPIGLLTDRDLVTRLLAPGLDPEVTRVEELMSAVPTTVDEEAPMDEALWIMRNTMVRRLPVVRRDGRLVGILTLDDLLSAVADELGNVQEVLQGAAPRGDEAAPRRAFRPDL